MLHRAPLGVAIDTGPEGSKVDCKYFLTDQCTSSLWNDGADKRCRYPYYPLLIDSNRERNGRVNGLEGILTYIVL